MPSIVKNNCRHNMTIFNVRTVPNDGQGGMDLATSELNGPGPKLVFGFFYSSQKFLVYLYIAVYSSEKPSCAPKRNKCSYTAQLVRI